MANIYQAKFNINEKILNVYKGELKLKDLLEKVLLKMNSSMSVRENNIKYCFYRLKKDYERNIIFGWVLKIYDEEIFNTFDENEDELDDITLKKVSYAVPFSFNLNSEIISFVTKQKFGYRQFIRIFKELFELNLPEIGYVNITMKVDEKLATEKYNQIDRMNRFIAVIVPPNGSDDLLDDMDGLIDDLVNGNVKEYRHELKSDLRDPLRKYSKIVNILRKIVNYGAGYYAARGKDKKGKIIEVNTKTDKNLFVKMLITDDKKDSPIEVMYISEGIVE